MQILITFDSTSDATLCSRAMRQEGISCYTMPIPRMLSASCGVCLVTEDDRGYEVIKGHSELIHRAVYKVLDGEYQPLKQHQSEIMRIQRLHRCYIFLLFHLERQYCRSLFILQTGVKVAYQVHALMILVRSQGLHPRRNAFHLKQVCMVGYVPTLVSFAGVAQWQCICLVIRGL